MNPICVIGYFADQGLPQPYGVSKQFTSKRSRLHYLTAFNKGGSTVYIELYDNADATGEPRVLPLAAGAVVGWSQLWMRNGIFVQACTDATAHTLIGSNDVKFDCGYTDEVGG